MRARTPRFRAIALGIAAASPAAGTTLLLDDFSSGVFNLSSVGSTSDSTPFVTPLSDQRTVTGVGWANWATTLDLGELTYAIQQGSASPRRNFLSMSYTVSSGSFDIAGYEAFALELSAVTGSGELRASVNGSLGGEIRLPIDAAGTVISPFTNLDTTLPLNALNHLNFRFYALSPDFSMKLDSIQLIPEPATAMLVAFGLSASLRRRRA